jgi:ComF family protein
MGVGSDMMEEPIAQKLLWGQRFSSAFHLLWRGLVDLVVPPHCLSCRAEVMAGASLCVTCWQKLRFIDEPVCNSLGLPFAYDEGAEALSPEAMADPPPWARARAAVIYDEASRRLVHLLKYEDTPEAGFAMAHMMAGAGRKLLAEADVILPIPLHRRRLWQRRANQSSVLALRLGKASNKPVDLLSFKRVTYTKPQIGLTAKERQKNVRKVFAVAPEGLKAIVGKRILLVDDVRTTGATARAATTALMDAGATNVDLLTFALVLEPAQLHIVE